MRGTAPVRCMPEDLDLRIRAREEQGPRLGHALSYVDLMAAHLVGAEPPDEIRLRDSRGHRPDALPWNDERIPCRRRGGRRFLRPGLDPAGSGLRHDRRRTAPIRHAFRFAPFLRSSSTAEAEHSRASTQPRPSSRHTITHSAPFLIERSVRPSNGENAGHSRSLRPDPRIPATGTRRASSTREPCSTVDRLHEARAQPIDFRSASKGAIGHVADDSL